ncbi:hypothetical protein LJR255_004899 [Pararhizobium sp. LjRoot255]
MRNLGNFLGLSLFEWSGSQLILTEVGELLRGSFAPVWGKTSAFPW